MTTPLAYPLQWPESMPRAAALETSRFSTTMARAIADLKDALRLFGQDTGKKITDVVISSNVTLGENRPKDPGVAVYFTWDGATRCIAVDKFRKPECNVRAIYYVLEARRQEARFGGLNIVRATFKGFIALPPPDDWRSVLGVGDGATIDDVEASFRRRAKDAHPDRPGGDAGLMAALNAARSAARRELGA